METLTAIAEAVQIEMQVKPTGAVFGSTLPDALRAKRYANFCGNALMHVFPWQILQKEHTFDAVAGEAQTNGYPADFDRILPETFFETAAIRLVYGPVSPQEWQSRKAASQTAGEKMHIRRNGVMSVYPAFAGGESCRYEYISNEWCESSTGAGQTAFAADDDLFRLDAELLIASMCMQWLMAEGQPAGHMVARYQERLNTLTGQDAPRPNIQAVDAALTGGYYGAGNGRHFDGVVASRGGTFY